MREKSRELLLSKRVLAGRRTYFIDVKQPADGERYLSISESKRVRGEPYERSRIIVLEEYISLFFDELRLVLESIGLLKPAKAYTVEDSPCIPKSVRQVDGRRGCSSEKRLPPMQGN